MPVVHLTKKNIDAIPFAKKLPDGAVLQVLYHDSDLAGFGLRVSHKTKTYFVQYSVHGRSVRTTIGRHGIFTPDQARKEAMSLLVDMTKGINPNRVKRDKKVKITTFEDAFEGRLENKEKVLSPSTIADYRRAVKNHLSDWNRRALQDITKNMVLERYRAIAKKYGEDAATKVMRIFSVTYNYARYLNMELPENPVVALTFTKSWKIAKRRQTVIRPHQLPLWYTALMAEENEIMRDYLLFMLFTGMRRSEAAQLKWHDVDFAGLTLTVHETKNGYSHTLPMGDCVKMILENRLTKKINNYVFPGTGLPGYIKDPKKAIGRVMAESGVKFSSHDLRRTFVTTAEKLDLSHYTIKYLINHRTNNDLTGGYIVLDIDRMREPIRRIEEKFLEMIKNEPQLSHT